MANTRSKVSSLRAVLTSTGADLIDFVLTLTVSLLSGSAVMAAKILQILADLIADAFLYLGVIRSRKSPDQKHPFGYGREVFIWTALSALVMLTVTATITIHMAWSRLIAPVAVEYVGLSLVVLSISLMVNLYALSVSSRRVFGRDRRQLFRRFLLSPRIEGKMAMISDLLGALSALVGIFALSLYLSLGVIRADAWGALAIGVLLVFSALVIMLGVRQLLIGSSVSPDIIKAISQATLLPEVLSVLDLKAVNIGPDSVLVSLDVHLRDGLNTDQVERVIDKIELGIRQRVPEATFIQIEPERPRV